MGGPDPPDVPDPAETYRSGIETDLEFLPQQLAAERGARRRYDPEDIGHQLWLQRTFGPWQDGYLQRQLEAIDPEWTAIRREMAGKIRADLSAGYDLGPELEREVEQGSRRSQAARGNILGAGAGNAETLFKGQKSIDLYNRRLANAGTFLSSPTPESRFRGMPSVQPDRNWYNVNRNAGAQGVQWGQQAYQNQLAGFNAAQNTPNPWASALAGAASGAAAGSAGGWVGAAAGGVIGGVGGYFASDVRLKTDLKLVGCSESGLSIYEFSYRSDKDHARYRGVMASDVRRVAPRAVKKIGGFNFVDYSDPLVDVPFEKL